MATLTAQNSTFAHAAQVAKDYVASAKDNFVKARMMRQTVAELQSLDTRDLADLGIARGEIKSVARKAVYGL